MREIVVEFDREKFDILKFKLVYSQ